MAECNIELIGVQDRIARIRLHGGCNGCPTSVMAVIMGIEEELRRRFPEIEYLEVVSAEPAAPARVI